MNYEKLAPKELMNQILGDRELCPCLLIGRYVNIFKQVYQGSIERAYTLDNVKSLVEEYEGVTNVNSGVLVLDGVGYLSDVGQNSLLKFIEESKLPIILLSFQDKVSPIIMSRMKMVFKLWHPVKSLNFSKVSAAQKSLNEKKRENPMKDYEEVQYLADNCPRLYTIKQSAGDPFDFSNRKMIEILCSKAGD